METACRAADLWPALERISPSDPLGTPVPRMAGKSGLAGGERRRLAIARALLAEPRILLLDEPSTGIDAVSVGKIVEAIRSAKIGRTVLFVDHDMDLVAALADQICCLEDGRFTDIGSPAELAARPSLFSKLAQAKKAYADTVEFEVHGSGAGSRAGGQGALDGREGDVEENRMADAKNVQAELMTRYLGLMPATGEDQVLRLIVETGVRAVGADEGSLLVYDPEANDLTFVMTYGSKESESVLIGQRVPFGQGLAGLAAETGEVQIGAPRYKDVRQSETMGGIKAVISAPMMLGDKLIGVITAVSNKDDKRFSMDDAQLYACLATVAALVVNQALMLRARDVNVDAATLQPAALSADPLAQDVLERVARLLQRDTGTVRQLARMLEAVEAMVGAPGGPR